MPFNAALIIAVVAFFLAIAVWFRTKRLGPVMSIVIGAFVVMAVTDPSMITSGANEVKKLITWAFSLITT